MVLARALETSVGYLCGETEFAIEGWDLLTESDRELFRRQIKDRAERYKPSEDHPGTANGMSQAQ